MHHLNCSRGKRSPCTQDESWSRLSPSYVAMATNTDQRKWRQMPPLFRQVEMPSHPQPQNPYPSPIIALLLSNIKIRTFQIGNLLVRVDLLPNPRPSSPAFFLYSMIELSSHSNHPGQSKTENQELDQRSEGTSERLWHSPGRTNPIFTIISSHHIQNRESGIGEIKTFAKLELWVLLLLMRSHRSPNQPTECFYEWNTPFLRKYHPEISPDKIIANLEICFSEYCIMWCTNVRTCLEFVGRSSLIRINTKFVRRATSHRLNMITLSKWDMKYASCTEITPLSLKTQFTCAETTRKYAGRISYDHNASRTNIARTAINNILIQQVKTEGKNLKQWERSSK